MFKDMEKWVEIRRLVLTGEISKRAACQEYGLQWRTLWRVLEHEMPAGYQRKEPKVVLAKKLYRDKTVSLDDICTMLKMSKSTLYRYVALSPSEEVGCESRLMAHIVRHCLFARQRLRMDAFPAAENNKNVTPQLLFKEPSVLGES